MSDELDGPIEIELTSHAPKRGRRRRDKTPSASASPPVPGQRQPEDSAVVTESDPETGWLDSERSRLVVTAGAVAVVALLIGWMLGRSGDDASVAGDAAAPAISPATTEPDDEPLDPAFEAAEDLPETDGNTGANPDVFGTGPTTSASPAPVPPPPRSTSVTSEPAGTTSSPAEPIAVTFDERLLGRDLTLITVDRDRRLLEIDLANGAVVQRGELLPSGVDRLIAGSKWVAMALEGSGRLLVERDDGLRTEIGGFDWWSLVVDADRGVFWGLEPTGPSSVGTYVEYGLAGEPTGRVIELPEDGWSAVYDDGAFLATVIGSAYRITPDGHERVTSGQILAASPSRLVLNDCDDELRCGLRIVERETGEERWLPPGPGGDDRRYIPFQWFYGSQSGNSMSPDGRWMMVVVPDEFSQNAGIIDLETGEFVELDELGVDGFATSLSWSPDSQLLFFVTNRIPWVHDVESGETYRLSEDLLSWSGLAVRDG